MSSKIQHLLAKWPTGAVRAVLALKKEGYSQDLVNRYRYSGWLKSVGDGAVAKAADEPTWIGALSGLQNDLKLDVHVGALSALELLGRGHYLRSGRRDVWLFGSKSRLPRWFTSYDWKVDIQYRAFQLFHGSRNIGLKEFKEGEISILISDEARAIFEFLSLVPGEQGIEEAKDLMLGLSNVHPAHVNALLKACTSIKVKRLFLLLAEECGHAWTKKLSLKDLDLGIGPRTLTPGGVLHKKYKITVPASILAEVIG